MGQDSQLSPLHSSQVPHPLQHQAKSIEQLYKYATGYMNVTHEIILVLNK